MDGLRAQSLLVWWVAMNTTDRLQTPLVPTVSRLDRLFPKLTSRQVARIEAHGRHRSTTRGEVLVEVGDKAFPFFVVMTGEIEAVRPSATAETLIVKCQPGQFSGESNRIAGRPGITRLRGPGPG